MFSPPGKISSPPEFLKPDEPEYPYNTPQNTPKKVQLWLIYLLLQKTHPEYASLFLTKGLSDFFYPSMNSCFKHKTTFGMKEISFLWTYDFKVCLVANILDQKWPIIIYFLLRTPWKTMYIMKVNVKLDNDNTNFKHQGRKLKLHGLL